MAKLWYILSVQLLDLPLKYRVLGYAADFCPLCRNIQTFSVCRATASESFAMSQTGLRSDGPAFHQTCASCEARLPSDPSIFASLRPQPADAVELLDATQPDIAETWGPRFDLEEKVCRSPRGVPEAVRRELIYEPFHAMAWEVDALYGARPHAGSVGGARRDAGFSQIGIVGSVFRAAAVAAAVPLIVLTAPQALVVVLGAVLLACFMVQAWRNHRRPAVLYRRVVPILARALAPLRPSRRELEDAMAMAAANGHEIGRRIHSSDLLLSMPRQARRRCQEADADDESDSRDTGPSLDEGGRDMAR
ncbi:hypothetical protein DB346_19570 [Verrucomicrobia bacterium LW23]|nr:hypothetical protein DB346_19570 [Verrucomicrobia bacterium LW23]